MTYEEAEALAALVDDWMKNEVPVTLTCAEDVLGELNEVPLRPDADVLTVSWYSLGQWKLTRHDSCDVTGGETIDQAVTVTHRRCDVLAQNGGGA